MKSATLSLNEARHIALAAQGFDQPRPAKNADSRQIARTIRRLGLLQLDFVNVLVPAHYLVPFSRLGGYRRSALDALVYSRREFTEQWAHEASIIPVEHWPLLRYRMETHRWRPYGFDSFVRQFPGYAEQVLEEVRARGPITAEAVAEPPGAARRMAGAWVGTIPRAMLEAHFGRGNLAVAARQSNFARVYDLADRIIPPEYFQCRMEPSEAQLGLMRLAARAHGIGTAADLADYYRMPMREARPALASLLENGELLAVRVEGWRETAFMHRDARLPKRIDAAALLSPFDPVLWFRPRTARLFLFEYRIEIYVPEKRRRWGYYVLPFLMGDRLVARIDLKADRKTRQLLVQAAHIEPGARPGLVVEALSKELRTLAEWLGLDSVVMNGRGNLARRLKQEIA